MSSFLLKIKIYPDGNQYCALLGKDIQSGVAGFGDSPFSAFHELCKNISNASMLQLKGLELSHKILKKIKNFTPAGD